jgi:hypothetical protein
MDSKVLRQLDQGSPILDRGYRNFSHEGRSFFGYASTLD